MTGAGTGGEVIFITSRTGASYSQAFAQVETLAFNGQLLRLQFFDNLAGRVESGSLLKQCALLRMVICPS